jgi:FkbM family methyltransferase
VTSALDQSHPLVSYSQNAEDIRLWRVFADVEHGFYVDVGAGDPVEYSLTKLFYDRAWSGINIEPGPAFSALAAQRARDINLQLAVAPEEGVRDLWVSSPHSGMSTFYPTATLGALPSGFTYERAKVECMPLRRILEEHAQGQRIDFMTIDVEGAEADVVRSVDFKTTRPTVLVIEAIRPLTLEATHEEWEPMVLDSDYVFAAFDGLNRFYVDRAREDVTPALAYPMSVLDRFVTAAELEGQRERLQLQAEIKRQRAEIASLVGKTSHLQAELAAVYGSRIWRFGLATATAANPLLVAGRRIRRGGKRAGPGEAYAAATAPRQAWHFPRAAASSRRSVKAAPLDRLLEALGPADQPLTSARSAEFAADLDRIDWTNEEALLKKRLSFGERQALVEADALVRHVARSDKPRTPVERSGTREAVIVVDARCLQDERYSGRGVGLHSRVVLDVTRAIAQGHRLVLLTSAELSPLDADIRAMADQIITTPYAVHGADVRLFVELSPMTASIAPVSPFLADEHCNAAVIVYDFIPTWYPRAYLTSPVARLENRLRLEALRHYDRLLPISQATATDCRRVLGDSVALQVTGVADPLDAVGHAELDPPQSFMLVPVGGDPRKNPAAAVAALARVRQATGTHLRAIVTGRLTGEQEAALRKLASRLELSDDVVELRGTVSESELAGLYAAANVAVVPSFAEGFSIPVAEAVIRQAPVVASDIAPHRELIGSGRWLADPTDIEALATALAYVTANRERTIAQQRNALGDISHPPSVRNRVHNALTELLKESREPREISLRPRPRPRLAVVSPFPPQRSGVADYTAFTFHEVAKVADVDVFSTARPAPTSALPVHPLSAEPYVNARFDAVVNVIGNSHFHFPILDLMSSYGGACVAHDDRMVEAYRHDRGDLWTAELISRPTRPVRQEDVLGLLTDLDRLPSCGYDIIARQASPLIVHGRAVADNILRDTGVSPVVIPFVPYNVPRVATIDERTIADARSTLALDSDALQIATFGIVDRRTKGVDLIVPAVAWLKTWGIRTQLHVVGEAPWIERRALRRLATELGIGPDVVLHGHVPRATLERFLLGVDVAVQLRTSVRLSLSGTLADCIAFGVPTVTSETSAAELDAPSYIATTPPTTSSFLIAETVLSLQNRRCIDVATIEAERKDYLDQRSPRAYADALLAALGLGPTG